MWRDVDWYNNATREISRCFIDPGYITVRDLLIFVSFSMDILTGDELIGWYNYDEFVFERMGDIYVIKALTQPITIKEVIHNDKN